MLLKPSQRIQRGCVAGSGLPRYRFEIYTKGLGRHEMGVCVWDGVSLCSASFSLSGIICLAFSLPGDVHIVLCRLSGVIGSTGGCPFSLLHNLTDTQRRRKQRLLRCLFSNACQWWAVRGSLECFRGDGSPGMGHPEPLQATRNLNENAECYSKHYSYGAHVAFSRGGVTWVCCSWKNGLSSGARKANQFIAARAFVRQNPHCRV